MQHHKYYWSGGFRLWALFAVRVRDDGAHTVSVVCSRSRLGNYQLILPIAVSPPVTVIAPCSMGTVLVLMLPPHTHTHTRARPCPGRRSPDLVTWRWCDWPTLFMTWYPVSRSLFWPRRLAPILWFLHVESLLVLAYILIRKSSCSLIFI